MLVVIMLAEENSSTLPMLFCIETDTVFAFVQLGNRADTHVFGQTLFADVKFAA